MLRGRYYSCSLLTQKEGLTQTVKELFQEHSAKKKKKKRCHYNDPAKVTPVFARFQSYL
jgi:hypothetical protein